MVWAPLSRTGSLGREARHLHSLSREPRFTGIVHPRRPHQTGNTPGKSHGNIRVRKEILRSPDLIPRFGMAARGLQNRLGTLRNPRSCGKIHGQDHGTSSSQHDIRPGRSPLSQTHLHGWRPRKYREDACKHAPSAWRRKGPLPDHQDWRAPPETWNNLSVWPNPSIPEMA